MKYLQFPTKPRHYATTIAATFALVTVPAIAMPSAANAAYRSCSSSTAVSSRPLLQYGDNGSCVKVAQRSLQSHNVSVGSAGADGIFGSGTRSGVIRFQRSKGLVTDGIVGPKTWGKLGGKTTTQPSNPPTTGDCQPRLTIRSGSRGECVRVAQSKLNQHGAGLSVDGVFGPRTRSATISYQRSASLAADGIIGPRTWAALDGGKGGNVTNPPSSSYDRSSGPNHSNRAILTFDDCPDSVSQMRTVSRWAGNHNIGLGMFPTGNCIKNGKFDVNYARSHGQYVVNHSISHPDLTTLSYSSIRHQLGAPGVVTNYGRPPYGAINSTVRQAYHAEGMRMWTWDVDTRDWEGKSRSQVIASAARANHGDTVLMHMQWNAFNPTAIQRIVNRLNDRGIGVCRAYNGTTPRNLPNSLPC